MEQNCLENDIKDPENEKSEKENDVSLKKLNANAQSSVFSWQ